MKKMKFYIFDLRSVLYFIRLFFNWFYRNIKLIVCRYIKVSANIAYKYKRLFSNFNLKESNVALYYWGAFPAFLPKKPAPIVSHKEMHVVDMGRLVDMHPMYKKINPLYRALEHRIVVFKVEGIEYQSIFTRSPKPLFYKKSVITKSFISDRDIEGKENNQYVTIPPYLMERDVLKIERDIKVEVYIDKHFSIIENKIRSGIPLSAEEWKRLME